MKYSTRAMLKELTDNEEYYRKLGLKCGLEIHQQLKTEKKLFCRCRAVLHIDEPSAVILRHMRPTLSELGEYDGTALMEFKTKKNVIYQLYNDTVCTYEMDDTPPFRINQQALDISLEIALLHNCSIVDELHISRKQYLDGSIPTGFQRTGIIGIEGWIPYKNRKIGIIQLGLEEDSCREINDVGHKIIFKTDRLSIPLVEVVTYPEIQTPNEAGEVANLIGRVLRSTGKVRRGLGSIRQDVNVSIDGGTRIELKGVSKLQYIAKAVAIEARRQKALLDIRDELRLRGVTKDTFQSEYQDVTSIIKNSTCKRFKEVIKNNGKIYGIILRVFGGILDEPTQPGKTFGDEIAGRVRVIACQDVMPNIVNNNHFEEFGLSSDEIKRLENLFNAKLTDSIILVWGNEDDVKTAVKEIRIRAVDATIGIPPETRQVFPDGSNDFERILPGPNRMYPDTDSPPTPILEENLEHIKNALPERIWDREKRLKQLGLTEPLVNSLSLSKNLKVFDKIVEKLEIHPMLVAVTLEEKLKWLRRKGKNVDLISDDNVYELFEMLNENKFSKEAIPVILEFLSDNPGKTIKMAIAELDITPMSIEELKNVIDESLTRYSNPKKISSPFKITMGEVMKIARNRIDGELVAEVVKTKLRVLNNE
ncbi:Glu-tRNA(Gln) amidotransferase GatDE subunit E [Thermoplasmatales archaeon ex4572_165]|nr:MAG: Glu-tRNA(Gln) amidotransferase GatDE subunit E [Thermoplasmatales archaeon ex4572_165]RLF58700.1 MAG: Glu-tRNA(Gln) amidotransferase GatDE subunit E [Thermoplasmata archaeon]